MQFTNETLLKLLIQISVVQWTVVLTCMVLIFLMRLFSFKMSARDIIQMRPSVMNIITIARAAGSRGGCAGSCWKGLCVLELLVCLLAVAALALSAWDLGAHGLGWVQNKGERLEAAEIGIVGLGWEKEIDFPKSAEYRSVPSDVRKS